MARSLAPMHALSRVVLTVALLAAAPIAFAQAPDADIFLARLSRHGKDIVVGTPQNVTHRAGYDNQPGFLPGSRAFLYTVVADGQADIWRYDITSHHTTRVTNTPESEYSATVMPGGRRFSAIRVERDSVQRLWSFALDGSDPELVLTQLRPVGYHAWLGGARLVTYVLGKPATLHVVDGDGIRDTIVARDVGRAVHRVPGRDEFTYTQRDSTTKALVIMRQALAGGGPVRVIAAAPDNEFHVWSPDGHLLTATNGQLVQWNGRMGDQAAWLPVATLASPGIRNVSRLVVSPDGRWLAFVADVSPP